MRSRYNHRVSSAVLAAGGARPLSIHDPLPRDRT